MDSRDERFRRTWDANVIGIVISDTEGRFKEANDAFLRIVGRSHEEIAAGRVQWKAITPPEWLEADQAAREQLASTGTLPLRKKEYVRPDGTRVPVLVGAALLEGTGGDCIGFVVDMTETRELAAALKRSHGDLERRVAERTAELSSANARLRLEIEERMRAEESLRRTEEQLRHSQKMDAIGKLAGGIAHDFNNILSVILGQAEVARRRDCQGDRAREALDEIAKAAGRAANLTRQLLAFSRQQVLQPRRIDLGEVVADMGGMLRSALGEDVELVSNRAVGLWRVMADPGQIEQVLLNLAVNARDAMPRGGRLTIETRNAELDEAFAAEHPAVRAGPHVAMTVTDTGVGMTPATLTRIFEPFFTTKELGKGTGLGLSTVIGIVEQSGGVVRVQSEPGRGTTFEIFLPRAPEASRASGRLPALATPERGTETVLLAEDDEQLRRLFTRVLLREGYVVLAAADAAEALSLDAGHAGPIDILLTDVVMPRMGGPELAVRLKGARPAMKVVFMSGYTDSIALRGMLDEGVEFLQKPVTLDTLLRKLRQVLGP